MMMMMMLNKLQESGDGNRVFPRPYWQHDRTVHCYSGLYIAQYVLDSALLQWINEYAVRELIPLQTVQYRT